MKKIFAIMAVATAVFAMASCEKYEDGRPSKDTRNLFEKMYPNAWDVEWEKEFTLSGTYWEVSFELGERPNGIDHTAKFDMDGNWIETEKDILAGEVPKTVMDALSAAYDGMVKDIDLVETPKGRLYRFEVSAGGVEIEVDVTESGDVSVSGGIKI